MKSTLNILEGLSEELDRSSETVGALGKILDSKIEQAIDKDSKTYGKFAGMMTDISKGIATQDKQRVHDVLTRMEEIHG